MNIWDAYEQRMKTQGRTKREAFLQREQHMLDIKIPEVLSFQSVMIDDTLCDVAIVNSDNLNEKTIFAKTDKFVHSGELVYWMDNYWLITECDANQEVYTKAKMIQCNHLLKWIDSDSKTHEQWCIIEDGTKYLTGEYEDRNFIVTRGDSRISMTISKNADTVKFNRDSRFLIDDPDASLKLSYQLTKPLKVGNVYENQGIYRFVLQEVVSTVCDNHELGIADYYKYFPNQSSEPDKEQSIPEKGVWL